MVQYFINFIFNTFYFINFFNKSSLCHCVLRFPFDVQSCEYKFGSWSYPIELIDLEHLEHAQLIPEVNPVTGYTQLISTVTYGIGINSLKELTTV